MARALIIGCNGQIGTELTLRLRALYGVNEVVGADIRPVRDSLSEGPFERLDASDKEALLEVISRYRFTEVYQMAAMLSARAEQEPLQAWDLNMQSLLYALEAARLHKFRLFWPSSIAVFGPGSPKSSTPQDTVMDPTTVYGISKLAGERWCAYYYYRHAVDVRSLRYPGLISWSAAPGGGTTDYTVDMYIHATQGKAYECYLEPHSRLPMMYMEDAITATVALMQVSFNSARPYRSYNVQGFSCTPLELEAQLKREFPDFKVTYSPDFRQSIADSWPGSMDDQVAREDWGWSARYDLASTSAEMVRGLMGAVNRS